MRAIGSEASIPRESSLANQLKKADARLTALRLLRQVEFEDAYANLALPKLLQSSDMDARDRALAQELAFGTIRWQLLYDRILEMCANRSVSDIDIDTLLVLRLGTHQLLATRIPPHAALSQTVELAKKQVSRGAAGFVNGVLRRVSERTRSQWVAAVIDSCVDEIERLSLEYSHPAWIVRALQQALKLDGRADEIEALLSADNVAPLVQLVALPNLHLRESEFVTAGPTSPIGFTLKAGEPKAIPEFRTGLLRVQDQGSQLAALALVEAKPVAEGERWLDLCAGPGGKAALLAGMAKQKSATLLCNEVSEHRAELVRKALSPVNPNVEVICEDGRELGARFENSFDRILLDAPCTGLGALRRRPESRWRKTNADVATLSRLQEELLTSAWQSLKSGGVLAYVTCSPHVAETNAIVDWALRKLPAVELLDATLILNKLSPGIELNTARKTVQLWPHIHNTDAMFIALFGKN